MTSTSVLEEFILSKDKKAYLESIKTAQEYPSLMVHYCLNSGVELPKELGHMVDKNRGSHHYRFKKEFLDLERETDEEKRSQMIKDLADMLNIAFHNIERERHVRTELKTENQEGQKQDNSVLKGDHGDVEALIEGLYVTHGIMHDFSIVGEVNLTKIDILKLQEPKSQTRLLEVWDNYLHLENIGEVFSQIKQGFEEKHADTKETFSLTHRHLTKMTPEQIKEVAEAMGSTTSLTVVVNLFKLEFRQELHQFGIFEMKRNHAGMKALLTSWRSKIQGRAELRAVDKLLVKCLVHCSFVTKSYDVDMALHLIQNPTSNDYYLSFKPELHKEMKACPVPRIDRDWENMFNSYFNRANDRNLLNQFIKEAVTGEEVLTQFAQYYPEKVLRRYLVENQTQAGGPIEAYIQEYGQRQADAYVERKRLLITNSNDRPVGPEDKVEVSLDIKNVSNLEVRIFAVDIINYLKVHNKYPDHNIDLTGLIPEKKQGFEYTQPKHQTHTEVFKFEELDAIKEGFFIIDFVGGGLMSRAVIQKGSLSLFSTPYEFGYRFFVLDSQKNICKGEQAGLFIDGKFLPADLEGAINIPYDSNHFYQQAILVNGNFGCMGQVEVDTENYAMKTALVFNDEGILPGRKARLILRNKLFLNNIPISITKAKEVQVNLGLVNLDGITNNKTYDNVKLQDANDYVLEFIIPNKLKQIDIVVTAKVDTVAQKQVTLVGAESVQVTRGENTYNIQNGFLERSPQGEYFFYLRGRNGEPLPDKVVAVQLKRETDGHILVNSLVTNSEGRLSLGKMQGIRSVRFQYDQGSLVSCLNDQESSIDIPREFRICEGEEICLPTTGLALTRDNFTFYQQEAGLIVRDAFDLIQSTNGGKDLTLQSLESGSYTLLYTGSHFRRVDITVNEAKRWSHSALVIEQESLLETVIGEVRYLDVSNINQTAQNLEINLVSNDMQNAVVHILGYHYNPRLINFMGDKLSETRATRNEKCFMINQPQSTFISEKQLGDELKYVMDRQSKKSFIGNTLKKPSILLHRKFIKETTENAEKLKQESGFDSNTFGATRCCMKRMMNDKMHRMRLEKKVNFDDYEKGYNVVSAHEYVANSGKTIANLNPDEQGSVVVPLEKLKGYSEVVVIAADTYGTVMNRVNLGENNINSTDLRLTEAKEAGVIYTEDRFCLVNEGEGEVLVEDMKNTQTFIIDDLRSLFDTLMVTSGKVQLGSLKFLTKWGGMSDIEKLKKFDEFGGEELNVFTYLKDRVFFDTYIKPILSFKSEKNLIDHILTGNNAVLESRFNFDIAETATPLEIVLLLDYFKDTKADLCKQILAGLQSRMEFRKVEESTRNSKFDSIIASKKIEEEPQFYSDEEEECDEECDEGIVDYLMDMDRGMPQMMMAPMAEAKYASPPPPMMSMAMAPGAPMPMARMAVHKRAVKIERYKKAGAAFEYGERHRYLSSAPVVGSLDRFWLDIAESIVNRGKNTTLTENFMLCDDRAYSILYALAFTDLPFTTGSIDSVTEAQALRLKSTENFIVVCKKIEEKTSEKLEIDLIVSQKFYDPSDMYSYDEKDPSIKKLKEVTEFLIGRRYSSRVTFTNISENSLDLKVIVQIPQGAMPLYKLDVLKIHSVNVSSLSTQMISFDFYFPSVGEFSCYPATIVKNNRLVDHSTLPEKLKVVDHFERGDKQLDSLQDILKYGSEEDILKFMEEKNIHNTRLFNINTIMWLFKEKEYYQRAISILRNKCFYDEQAWTYSVLHGDHEAFMELIRNRSDFRDFTFGLKYLKTKYFEFDAFVPLEYDPLINPRAHSISDKKQNIRNKSFKETYKQFLEYCSEKPELSTRDSIIFTAYLILQDRVEEALEFVKNINAEEVTQGNIMKVQFDYIRAYLSIYEEYPEFKTAREVCSQYSEFGDLSWRKMFGEIQGQLDEFDGAQAATQEGDDSSNIKHATNKEMTDRAEYLKAESKLETNEISLTSMNVSSITVKFFKLDMEVLFSKDPFLSKNTSNFSFVNPNQQHTIEMPLSTDFVTKLFPIPENLRNSSLFVHIQAGSKTVSLKIFNSSLNARAIEDFGMLKVSDNDGKLLSKIYVKCFYEPKNGGEAKFYKDGYTDFRGSFDYASLNSDSLDKVKRFSILVVDEKYGATILEAVPPRKVGQIRNA